MTTMAERPDGHLLRPGSPGGKALRPPPAGTRYSVTNLGSGICTAYDAGGRVLGEYQRWAPVSEKDKAHARQHAPKDGPIRVTPPSPWPR
ncbi:MAG: hypothetical protein JWO74_2290 [Solirubrobacterales bacterium]|nr:hypothetical protein [Solirubrobacterales bacterium]